MIYAYKLLIIRVLINYYSLVIKLSNNFGGALKAAGDATLVALSGTSSLGKTLG